MAQSFLPQWLTDLSTCLTIIGFILTYVVFNQVKSIKNQFLSKARLPQLNEQLGAASSKIIELLRERDANLNLIAVELSNCAGIIENIIKKLDRTNREPAQSLLNKLRQRKWFKRKIVHIKLTDTDQVWEIYNELTFLNTNLAELMKDSNWK